MSDDNPEEAWSPLPPPRDATYDELLALLARHRDRVEVYLQYDGPSKEASIHHRGGDLTRFKDMAIARLSEAGVFTTLTMTATLGVNDGEVDAVVMSALETPFAGGVALQPVFGSGRGHGIDPTYRLTNTGVLERLAEQTGAVVSWHDLTALPCSHPHCASVGYMLKDDSGAWRSLTALIGHDQLLAWLELNPDSIANRIADSAIPIELRNLMKSSLLNLLSEQSSLSHPRTMDLLSLAKTMTSLSGILSRAVRATTRSDHPLRMRWQKKVRRLPGSEINRFRTGSPMPLNDAHFGDLFCPRELQRSLGPTGLISAAEQLQVRGTGLCADGGLPSPKVRLSKGRGLMPVSRSSRPG